MYQGKRVVAFTPYGRKRTVSLLYSYLKREQKRGLLDEWMLCMNTDDDQHEDVEYATRLARNHSWIKKYKCPGPGSPKKLRIPETWRDGFRKPKQLNTGRFYIYMQDRDTIYVRFDDDIIWLHDAALVTLVDRKIRRPENLCVFPVIVNNAISTWYLQKYDRYPTTWGAVQPHAVDPLGWGDPVFAERLHRHLLEAIRGGWVDQWLCSVEQTLDTRQQFSVSCFAVDGNDYADQGGVLDWDEEEHWHTMHRPGSVHPNRPNIVYGQALVSHFTFYTQRDRLLRTNILDQYRDLAAHIPQTPTPPALLSTGETAAAVTVDDPELDAKGQAYYDTLTAG